jgi:hypothetical protein
MIIATGMAPPGARIVHDVSWAPDDDATAASTGAWSMPVTLAEGSNSLTFRLGDDRSTAQTIVVYLTTEDVVGGGFLEITSPANGSIADTRFIVVRGLATPRARVVRDISLAPDDETFASSSGEWSMSVELDVGLNTLVFRIGDDRSTEQVLRVLR